MITIKNQNFGVEIEMTGITRTEAATVIANYFGSRVTFEGGYYDTHTATDTKGRTWKCMYDGSIHCQVVRDGDRVFANKSYSCEVVTPILQYDDILHPAVQGIHPCDPQRVPGHAAAQCVAA